MGDVVSRPQATSGRRRWAWGPLAMALAGLLVLLSLAFWQWQRAAEKQTLRDREQSRAGLAALDWQGMRALGEDVADRPVRLQGRFDDRFLVALDNQLRNGRAGQEVFAVFHSADGSQAVLVNLGWQPSDRQGGPAIRRQVPAVSEIIGVADLPPAYVVAGAPQRERGLWRAGRIEPAHWAQYWQLPLLAWTVRLSPEVPGGYLRDWAPRTTQRMGPDQHRGYAVQWLALALAWCLCWWAFWRHAASGEER